MKQKTEYDFIDDRHTQLGYSPEGLHMDFSSGDSIKLSWEAVRAFAKLINQHDKKYNIKSQE